MGCNLSFYSLKLIKEHSGRYEIEKKITSATDVYNYAKTVIEMDTMAEECFYMITLNTKNVCTGIFKISQGSLDSTIVHPREVFKRALTNNSSRILVMHNHPSGNITPSKEDIAMTNRLSECGDLLGIKVLDHLIIGENDFYSFKQEGEL